MTTVSSLQFDHIMSFVKEEDPGLAKIITAGIRKVNDTTLTKVIQVIKKSPHFPSNCSIEELESFTNKFIFYHYVNSVGRACRDPAFKEVVMEILAGRRSRL